MMTDRTLRHLGRSIEAAASQALGKPARVVLLQAGELAEEVRAQYFQENSAAVGRLELIVVSLPPPAGRGSVGVRQG